MLRRDFRQPRGVFEAQIYDILQKRMDQDFAYYMQRYDDFNRDVQCQ